MILNAKKDKQMKTNNEYKKENEALKAEVRRLQGILNSNNKLLVKPCNNSKHFNKGYRNGKV